MNQNHLRSRCPSSEFIKTIKLNDYKFVLDINGVGSIIPFKDSYVEGVLYKISIDEIHFLDDFEGVNYNIYKKEFLDISINDLNYNILIYTSLNNKKPFNIYPNYMESIIKTAEYYNFSKEYIDYLKSFL